MPAWNAETTIAESIESVKNQSLEDWELIVVDDASSDTTCETVRGFCALDERVTLLPLQQNSGAAKARNTAIEASRGRFIAFLDSDDLWYADKLKAQVEFMQHEDIELSYGAYVIKERQATRGQVFTPPDTVTYKSLLKTCDIGCLTAMYDTSACGKVFMPDVRRRQDYGLWLRLLKTGVRAARTPGVLGVYHTSTDSLSGRKLSAAHSQWKIYRDQENLDWWRSAYYFCHYAVRGLQKHHAPDFVATR